MHQQILFYKNGLTNTKHDLKVVACGEGNFLSEGKGVCMDAIQYSAATGESDYGVGGGPKGSQRWIFGYTSRMPYKDSQGHDWLPGTEFVIRGAEYNADTVAMSWITKANQSAIANTAEPELYRYGVHGKEFTAYFTVGPGWYYVRLKFAQSSDCRDPREKAVSISINEKDVVKDMDVKATASGINRAVDLVFNNIEPRHGVIEIRFYNNHGGEAEVQAIEIGAGEGGRGAAAVGIKL